MPSCKGTVLFSTAIVKPLIALSNCKPGSVHVFRPKLLAECCSEPFLVVLRIQGSLISSQAGTCQTLGNDVVNSRAVGTVLPQGGTLVTQGWVSKTQKHSEADRGGIPYFAVRAVFYVNTVSLHRLCFVDARQMQAPVIDYSLQHAYGFGAFLCFRRVSMRCIAIFPSNVQQSNLCAVKGVRYSEDHLSSRQLSFANIITLT